MCPAPSVLRPASSVCILRSVTAKVFKIMSADFMQIFCMCAKRYGGATCYTCLFVVPKALFNILIFFSEPTSRWCLILCHYIS